MQKVLNVFKSQTKNLFLLYVEDDVGLRLQMEKFLSKFFPVLYVAKCGAAAGITYMLSENRDYIANAISNVIQDLSGIVCDGAKLGCSFKVATAAEETVSASLLSINGVKANPIDGIMGNSVEESIKNLWVLSKKGMAEADKTMLDTMIKKSS